MARRTAAQKFQLDKARTKAFAKQAATKSQSKKDRAKTWQAGKSQRAQDRRNANVEAREKAAEYIKSRLSDQIRDDRNEATFRALRAHGFSEKFITTHDLTRVGWDNKSLKSLRDKFDRMARRGLTTSRGRGREFKRGQIEAELERRLNKLKGAMGDWMLNMLDLVREGYTKDAKGRLHRVSHMKISSRRAYAARKRLE